jgi:myo-inositol-1(or 4)-monophosphatase
MLIMMLFYKEHELAVRLARVAGHILKGIQRDQSQMMTGSGKELHLDADQKSEKKILDLLSRESPHPILSKESHEHGKINPGALYWVVDPLDGTLNYWKMLPLSCVSIALWNGDAPVLGVIYDFNHEHFFEAVMGQIVNCNNKPIKVSNVTVSKDAVLATGFSWNWDLGNESFPEFLRQVHPFKKVRMLGSAALSLAYVACGKLDAYFEEEVYWWDVAAGITLVKAAGGFVDVKSSKTHPWRRTVKAASHADIWKGS